MDFTALDEKVKTMLTTGHLFNGYDIETKGLDMQDM